MRTNPFFLKIYSFLLQIFFLNSNVTKFEYVTLIMKLVKLSTTLANFVILLTKQNCDLFRLYLPQKSKCDKGKIKYAYV